MLKIFFLTILVALATSFNIQGRIANGNDAKPNIAPYMVSIQVEIGPEKYHHSCGGAIIDKNWVLTAAHCLQGKKDQVLKSLIKAGRHNIHSDTEEYAQHRKFDYYKNHDKYPPGEVAPYDIALIHVEEPFEWTEGVQPINLPTIANKSPENIGTLYGWGILGENGDFPSILQTADIPILSLESCIEKLGEFSDKVHETNVCTLHPDGKSACRSDSGGPLVQINDDNKTEIIGVVSWGPPCGQKNNKSVSVFVKVSSFIDWIANVKKDYEAKC